jgi:hypothetical protein
VGRLGFAEGSRIADIAAVAHSIAMTACWLLSVRFQATEPVGIVVGLIPVRWNRSGAMGWSTGMRCSGLRQPVCILRACLKRGQLP